GVCLRLHAAARAVPGDRELPSQEAARRRAPRAGATGHVGLLLVEARRHGAARHRVRPEGGRGMTEGVDLREDVRRRYAEAAVAVSSGTASGCCDPGTPCSGEGEVFGPELYEALADEHLPEAAVLASMGCGNPTA